MIEKMKQAGKDIFETAIKNGIIKSKYYLMTPQEYYSSEFVSPSERSAISKALAPHIKQPPGGRYTDGKIVVLLQSKGTEAKSLLEFIEICFHEMQHERQESFNEWSYDGFLRDMESFIARENPEDYKKEHDKYSLEIGANLHAVLSAKEYMQEKYPNEYVEVKELIKAKEDQFIFDYMTYDSVSTFERMLQIFKHKHANSMAGKSINIEEISPILEIFLNTDGSFKPLSKIIEHEKFAELDNRIKFSILTSKTFLESINIEQLSNEESFIMDEALKYMGTVYKNQEIWLKKEGKIRENRINVEKSLWSKLKVIAIYLQKNYYHKTNPYRDDALQQQHKDNVSKYQGKTKVLKKSQGYITINIFYIIGLILSILTITYLIIK